VRLLRPLRRRPTAAGEPVPRRVAGRRARRNFLCRGNLLYFWRLRQRRSRKSAAQVPGFGGWQGSAAGARRCSLPRLAGVAGGVASDGRQRL